VKTRLAIGVVGVLLMGYGVYGAVTDTGTNLPGQLLFLALVLIAHDFVLLPTGLAVGALAARALPRRYRLIIQSGLWTSAVVALISLPFVAGPGHLSPRNYTAGLLGTLAVIWLTAGVLLLVRRRRA
jgi:hypothetical protein